MLDEPSTKQSDPTVLSLWLTENSKQHNITVSQGGGGCTCCTLPGVKTLHFALTSVTSVAAQLLIQLQRQKTLTVFFRPWIYAMDLWQSLVQALVQFPLREDLFPFGYQYLVFLSVLFAHGSPRLMQCH